MACYNAGFAYNNGKGGFKQNKSEAARYYKLACDYDNKSPDYKLHSVACLNLGVLYIYGEGVKQDEAEARRLWSVACENDNALACDNIGILFEDDDNFIKAKEYYKKACDLGLEKACKKF